MKEPFATKEDLKELNAIKTKMAAAILLNALNYLDDIAITGLVIGMVQNLPKDKKDLIREALK